MANTNNNEENKQKEKKLKALFDSYDSRGVTSFISDRFLQSINNKSNWDENVSYKVGCIRKFVSIIQSQIDIKYGKSWGTKFDLSNNLHFYTSANMPKIRIGLEVRQFGKSDITPASINIPLDRLVKMPALEVYALMSAYTHAAVKAASMNKANDNANVNIDDDKYRQRPEEHKEINKTENDNDRIKATDKLANYLEEFLPKVAGGEFKEFDDISKVVAAEIVSGLDEDSLEKVLSPLFLMNRFDTQATEKVAEFVGKEVWDLNTRTGKLYEKAENLWVDPEKEVEALSATQQYQSLMDVKLQDSFAEIVKNNKDGRIQDSINLREFCQNYVNALMRASNLKSVKVEFIYNEKSDDLGTYVDKGNEGAEIVINLSKISSSGELITTLSHETTHAIESAINKIKGQKTEDGFGLDENISNNISTTTLASIPDDAKFEDVERRKSAYNLLKEINRYCYRINPHERKARYGETVGLKFLTEGCKIENPIELKQLENMAHRMENYQKETLRIMEMIVDEKSYAALQDRIKEVLDNSELYKLEPQDKALFIERRDYISKMRTKLIEQMRRNNPNSKEVNFENEMENESLKDIRRFIQKQEEKNAIAEMTADIGKEM